MGRVGTTYAAGPPGNLFWGIFPRSFRKEESGELETEVRELGLGHWAGDKAVRWGACGLLISES